MDSIRRAMKLLRLALALAHCDVLRADFYNRRAADVLAGRTVAVLS